MSKSVPAASSACVSDARVIARTLVCYREPSSVRSVVELVITLGPLILIWAAMGAALKLGYPAITVVLALPAAGFLLRTFLIQHDCGHGSFFPTRRANDWVGRVLAVLTLTPYDYWRRTHAAHHAGAGNLDRRGMGDVDTFTVREYAALPLWRRVVYRLYRHPAVLFGLGPAYLFFLQNRIPFGLTRAGMQPWISTMGTNLALGLAIGLAIWLLGWWHFLVLYVPVTLLAASAGVWLFYVQHQFEHTLWQKDQSWDALEAALHGSSHYDLPPVLRWITANIGVHHVHHLASRVPYYRLQQVLRDHPELRGVGRLTLRQSLGCVRLSLWDEERDQLVSFRDARSRMLPVAPAFT